MLTSLKFPLARVRTPPPFPQLTARSAVTWVLIGLILCIIFDADSRNLARYVLGLTVGFGILLSVVFISVRWLVLPLFMIMLNAQDLTQSAEDVITQGAQLAANPWQFSFGFVSPAASVFLMLAVILVRLRTAPDGQRDWPLLVYFFGVVPVMSFVYGYAQESISQSVTDAKVAIFFCASVVAMHRYYRQFPQMLLITGQIFLCLASSRSILDTYYLFAGVERTMISEVNRVSTDSAKGLVTALIFFLSAGVFYSRRRIACLLTLPVAVYLLLSFQTRWLVITLIAGALLILLWLDMRRALFGVLVFGTVAWLSLPILIALRPETIEILSLRFSSIEFTGRKLEVEGIDATRTGSIVNSVGLLGKRWAFATGLGLGSWYSDESYPMPILVESDFEQKSIMRRQFYRIHDFTFHFLFKFGIIGLVLYVGAFLRPMHGLWRLRWRIIMDIRGRIPLLVMVGTLPMVVTTLYWTGKGLIISGFLVATARAWLAEMQRARLPVA